MPDSIRLYPQEQDNDAQASLGALLDTRPCPSCQSDLCRLPMSAGYCPHCGWDLRRSPGSDGSPRLAPIAAPPGIRSGAGREHAAAGSPILRGFAAALYRLGVRYDRGLGASRNSDEARRCYGKAAKLGNSAAIARLRDDPAADDP